MSQDPSNEKRHFTRIPFNATASVTSTNSGQKYMAELLDISLKGVLIRKPDDWQGNDGDEFLVDLQLAGSEVELKLNVIVVHIEGSHVGFKTEQMDLDTATHLHRLLELNLGDEKLLERELSELINSN